MLAVPGITQLFAMLLFRIQELFFVTFLHFELKTFFEALYHVGSMHLVLVAPTVLD